MDGWRPRAVDTLRPNWERPWAAAATAVLVMTSVVLTTWAATSPGTKVLLVLPLAAAAGFILGLLALTRFVVYVHVLLVVRASLDLAQVGWASSANDLSFRALDPSSLFAVVFLVTAALWLTAQRHTQALMPYSPVRRALVAFFFAGCVSLIGTSDVAATSVELLRVLAAVLMFCVLERLMLEPKTMWSLLRAVYLSAIFPLAFTILDIATGSPRSEIKDGYVRLLGPFNQSNTFGRYLMLLVIFGVAIVPRLDRRSRRFVMAVLGAASPFLVLTYTRSAIVGTILGLIVVGVFQDRRILLGLVVGITLVVLLDPRLGARFAELDQGAPIGAAQPGNSLEWRFQHWSEILTLSTTNPLTGIGLATTQRVTEDARQPHNDFVRTYVETGIVGFIAYIALIVALLQLGWRATRRSALGSFDRSVAVGYFGCAVAFVATSVVANLISNVVTLWYFLAFAAAAAAVVSRQQHELTSSQHDRPPGCPSEARSFRPTEEVS